MVKNIDKKVDESDDGEEAITLTRALPFFFFLNFVD